MEEFEDAYFLISCQYCGEEFPAISLDEHEDMCNDIQLAHLESMENQGNVDEQAEEFCNICGENFPVICMQDHMAVCEANYNYAFEVQIESVAAENKDDDKSALNEIQNEQKDSAGVQGTQKEAKTEIKKGSKLREARTKTEEAKNSKKSANVFTTDFEAQSSNNFEVANPTKNSQKYPPIECEDTEDSTDDLKCISDDDCEETLEEFWTRAREILKRRRMLNAQ